MQLISQPLILLFVVSTMLGVGLMLGVRDIAASLQDRRWLVRALLANFVLLPALAFAVARLLQLDVVLSAALLVLATAPGGPVLVKLAALAKADHALAVGLLVILLLLGVISQPLLLPLLLDEVSVDAEAIVTTLIATVLTPLIIGLALRARRANWAARLQLPVQRLSTLSMLLIWIVLPLQHWQDLVEIARGNAFPAAALFIVLAATGGWLLGGPQAGPRQLLSLSCSQPNLAAAVVIASENFSDPRVMLMLLVVMLTSIPILLPLCLLYAHIKGAEALR
ncbi:bile acid:sodium symporter family protein [Pseudomonas sp. N040]|uniref:bile acid:sodium symporter family protein n=1 Tax=Pseudomonas sp. N040 TaxID=2785325 RepID=UPI0018A257CA|nr:bile acid:sodium symporter [Pseudomonas sp. N040]MBF7731551.1 bile acid:sodium symporter [Pseudomonas sp. N040]MBW7015195.1 bile acid:sodium symporter [Pseudomonas sp. N040]